VGPSLKSGRSWRLLDEADREAVQPYLSPSDLAVPFCCALSAQHQLDFKPKGGFSCP
jgi:hypothetical protein